MLTRSISMPAHFHAQPGEKLLYDQEYCIYIHSIHHFSNLKLCVRMRLATENGDKVNYNSTEKKKWIYSKQKKNENIKLRSLSWQKIEEANPKEGQNNEWRSTLIMFQASFACTYTPHTSTMYCHLSRCLSVIIKGLKPVI